MGYRKMQMRVARRRAMSGVTSQPPGLPVASTALGGLGGHGARALPPGIRAGRALAGMPNWYAAMQGTALGADDQGSLQTPTLVEPGPQMTAWQERLLSQSQATDQTIQKYMATETRQRWVQIAATLSIPLAAAIWRLIFGVGRQS